MRHFSQLIVTQSTSVQTNQVDLWQTNEKLIHDLSLLWFIKTASYSSLNVFAAFHCSTILSRCCICLFSKFPTEMCSLSDLILFILASSYPYGIMLGHSATHLRLMWHADILLSHHLMVQSFIQYKISLIASQRGLMGKTKGGPKRNYSDRR